MSTSSGSMNKPRKKTTCNTQQADQCFSETSVYLHCTTGRYIPKDKTIWHVTVMTSIAIGDASDFMKLSS
jgi:hypothetical protein